MSSVCKRTIPILLCALGGCSSQTLPVPAPATRLQPVLAEPSAPRPPFHFSQADEVLLTEIQRGAFRYLWEVNDPATGMVLDRTSAPHVSVAGVGFQLAAIPIAVERHWISHEQGRQRVLLIARSLSVHPEIRVDGVFSHFIDSHTGSLIASAPESVASTVDSALLFSGMIVASQYFGADVASVLEPLIDGPHWQAYLSGNDAKPYEQGFISLGKRIESHPSSKRPALLPYYWVDAGCEHRLVTFLAVGAARPECSVPPETYYKLRRPLGNAASAGQVVYFPFSGALFTSQFSHCFMNYAKWGPDHPEALGVPRRRSVDWWENSRRMTLFHAAAARTSSSNTVPNGWGFTASDCPGGYQVPGIYPDRIPEANEQPEFDYSTFVPKNDLGDGTIAPYAAGTSIMFEPRLAVEALRTYRNLTLSNGIPVWSSPDQPRTSGGGFGLADAFREVSGSSPAWRAPDHLAIDQGPLLLAIENARTGLVWKLFESHPLVQRSKSRLKIK